MFIIVVFVHGLSAAKLLQKTQLSPKVSLLSRACLVILTHALNKTDQNRAFLYAGVGKTSTVMAVKVGGFAWFDHIMSRPVLFAMASDCLFSSRFLVLSLT